MKILDSIPDKPEVFNCETHGDYEARYLPWSNRGKFMISDYCAKCSEERDEQKRKDDLQEENKREVERKKKCRLNAGISLRNLGKTFDQFIAKNHGQQNALTQCKAFAEKILSGTNPGNLFLTGNVGTGKTHLASSIIDHIVDKKTCSIIRVIELMRELKATWSRDSEATEQGTINFYTNRDLLIIDEIGIQFGSEAEKMFMFDIINVRYENLLPTVIISNLAIQGIKGILGEQAVDRLKEDGGNVLAFDWESLRGKL